VYISAKARIKNQELGTFHGKKNNKRMKKSSNSSNPSSSSPSSSNPQKLSHITIGGTPIQLNYSSSNQQSSVGFSGSSSSSSGSHSTFMSSRNNDNAPQLLANEIRSAKEYTESETLLEQRTKYIK
jgi:hypothetical protein